VLHRFSQLDYTSLKEIGSGTSVSLILINAILRGHCSICLHTCSLHQS